LRRRSSSRTNRVGLLEPVPGGISTDAQIWRGSLSGKNSMPWLKAPNSTITPRTGPTCRHDHRAVSSAQVSTER